MRGTGVEAVKCICAERPVPTVYIVSNPEEVETPDCGSAIIRKPVARGELRKAVATLGLTIPTGSRPAPVG